MSTSLWRRIGGSRTSQDCTGRLKSAGQRKNRFHMVRTQCSLFGKHSSNTFFFGGVVSLFVPVMLCDMISSFVEIKFTSDHKI